MSFKEIDFIVREIKQSDLQKGFFQTISNLTKVGDIRHDIDRANNILHEIKSSSIYKTFVAVKLDDEEIIGTITLLLEQKFLHNGGICARLEDLATKKEYEGIGVGSSLIKAAIGFARKMNCYKVILDCNEKLKPFYEKNGFKNYNMIAMTMYLKECTCSS